MTQYYDITLKSILKEIPRLFLKKLTGFDSAKFLDVQFPEIKYRQPDLLLELPDKSIFHMEIQSYNEAAIDWRMHDYFCLTYHQSGREPIQVLLYVGNAKPNMEGGLHLNNLQFKYRVVNIMEIDCSELLESDDPGDAVLAILCSTDNYEETIRAILSKLVNLPTHERETYILKLLNLSRLRGLTLTVKEEIKKMPVTIDITKDELYLEGLAEGELKGLATGRLEGLTTGRLEGLTTGRLEGLTTGRLEGLAEGERNGLLNGIELVLEVKHGSQGIEIMEHVRKIETVEQLKHFSDFIKHSATLDDLRAYLNV